MQKKVFAIHGIPVVVWGSATDRVIIAVHGNMSHKADVPIQILAENAVPKGYQVLSFDLPEHGDRLNQAVLCKVQHCVKELETIIDYAKSNWNQISLFANSLGAYFSLLAYKDETLEKVWFLSPIVNMQRLIENMMLQFSITEVRLETEKTISTPIGQNLYWDYYCYVKEHPILHWNAPTFILYGSDDVLIEYEDVRIFAEQTKSTLTVVNEAEHYFHTQGQLEELNNWIAKTI